MKLRPSLFEETGEDFVGAFGNVDAVFTVDGADQPAVRAILRQWRDIDEAEEQGQAVEGTTHVLAVAASSVTGLVSQRDSVTVYELDDDGNRTGISSAFDIRNHSNDARAMLRIQLSGDI
jgi:hypothetical protein